MSRRILIACGGAVAVAVVFLVVNVGVSPGSPLLLRWMYAVWLAATTLQSQVCILPGDTVSGSYSAVSIRVYGDQHFAMVGRAECRSLNGPPAQMEFLSEYNLIGYRLWPNGSLGSGEPTTGPGKYLGIGSLTGSRLSQSPLSADGPVTAFTAIVRDPTVAQVAFRLSTGRYDYQQPTSELVAITTLGTEGVCEYIALDKYGQELERIDLSNLSNIDPELKVGC